MKVLFVEDNPLNRHVVQQMLRAADIEMDEAENGFEGLSMIATHDYDVILMDLRMPRMDGLTALRNLRARSDDKGRLPVIVITADIAADVQVDCLAAGANDLLQKPISMQLLFDAIGRVITSDEPGEAMFA